MYSDYTTLSAGLPQGLVLSPILFIIYINSLFKTQLYGHLIAFADDMALPYRSNKRIDLTGSVNFDISLLQE